MKYNGTNLKEVLVAHMRWLEESDGWSEDDRADLTGAYLMDADLGGAILRRANLHGACLCGADLCMADLAEANLCMADLNSANLFRAILSRANLNKADLTGADLRKACLIRANLRGAKLYDADLTDANLARAKNVPFVPMVCPDTGAFVAWKKCCLGDKPLIVKLLIPEDAKRSSATGRKCRCDKAIVLDIQNPDGTETDIDTAYSIHNPSIPFMYKVGQTVTPWEPFDEDRFNECASGIHFFVNRQEAVDYWMI